MPKLTATRATRPVTVQDVYGETLAQLEGRLTGRMEYMDFAIPVGPVRFLALNGEVKTHDPASTHKFGGPRLIIEERRIRRIIFTETGTMRVATANDHWVAEDGSINNFPTTQPVMIATRTIEYVA